MWPQCKTRKHCWLCRDAAKGGQFRASLAAFHKLPDSDFICPEGYDWGDRPAASPSIDIEARHALNRKRLEICLQCGDRHKTLAGKCGLPDKKCGCCPLKKW